MELATALIWALRIVLPIILLCIYFKLQSPKDDDSRNFPGPTKNAHPRARLLNMRKAVEGEPAPDEVKTMKLISQEENPDLFVTPARRGGGGRSGGKEERGERTRGERKDRGDREERKERKERKERDADTAGGETPVAADTSAPEAVAQERDLAAPPQANPEEDKQQLESLLNYVAFNRKEQQRTFIHDEDGAPPPPPPPAKKDAQKESAFIPPLLIKEPTTTGEGAAKANLDAQLVLNGAMKFKRADVAKNLYDQLLSQDVEISEKTFALMIESCVAATDLKSASDLLMKMEASGHSPDTSLLDKVMDLYSQQKTRRDQEKTGGVMHAPLTSPSVDDAGDGGTEEKVLAALAELPRTKLSSEANLFTPTFNSGFGAQAPAPPPPPPPAGPKPGTEGYEASTTQLRADAASFDAVDTSRTALKATSKAFQPSGTVTFNPYEYTWTVNEPEEKGKGKGKGKDKGKGKSADGKGKGKEKDDGGKGKDKGKAAKGKESAKEKDDPKAKAKAKSKDSGSKWVVKA